MEPREGPILHVDPRPEHLLGLGGAPERGHFFRVLKLDVDREPARPRQLEGVRRRSGDDDDPLRDADLAKHLAGVLGRLTEGEQGESQDGQERARVHHGWPPWGRYSKRGTLFI